MAVGNKGDVVISQTSFYGGQGTDKKIGIKNAYGDTENMDARKNPSSLSVLPGSRKIIDADLTGLINSMEQTPDGLRWGISTNGKLFKVDLSDNISLAATMTNWTDGTFGDVVHWPLTDSLYITGADRVYQYAPLSGSPTVTELTGSRSTYPTVAQILVQDRDGKWIGGGTDRWAFKTGGAGTYTVPTSLSETDDNKCIFLPDQSPMVTIQVMVRAKPASGNLTLTVHDEQNKQIAQQTVAVGAIGTVPALATFNFPQTKLGEYKNFGTEYHIHLTASTSGFTVDTYEASKLYGLHFYYFAALLIDTLKGCHPILNWAGSKLLIGNGQYLVDWLPSGLTSLDASEFQRHRVIIETGQEITSLTSNDEYVAMGCEKVSIVGSRIFQSGMIGFWDGFADAINFKIDTPMGEPKSLYTNQNITYTIIDGAVYAYTGGKVLTKIRTIQDSQSEFSGVADNTDVFSHCMTVRRGILLMAYPSITALTTMRHGVYSWGSIDKNYPNSFYYSYNIPEAQGNYNTENMQYLVGGIWNFGDTLYFSYAIHDLDLDTYTYGLAIVDNTSKPASTFKYESLTYDGGVPWKEKHALRLAMSMKPLPDGTTINLKYRTDNGDWVLSPNAATNGAKDLYFEINKRFREIEFGFDGENTTNVTVSPVVTGVMLNARQLDEETKAARNG